MSLSRLAGGPDLGGVLFENLDRRIGLAATPRRTRRVHRVEAVLAQFLERDIVQRVLFAGQRADRLLGGDDLLNRIRTHRCVGLREAVGHQVGGFGLLLGGHQCGVDRAEQLEGLDVVLLAVELHRVCECHRRHFLECIHAFDVDRAEHRLRVVLRRRVAVVRLNGHRFGHLEVAAFQLGFGLGQQRVTRHTGRTGQFDNGHRQLDAIDGNERLAARRRQATHDVDTRRHRDRADLREAVVDRLRV